MSHVDLHCHLLPGIDDGARTEAAMLAHARRLAANGVHDVACTPHVKRDMFPGVRLAELADRRARAQAAIDAAGIALRLHPGGELAHPDALALPPEALELIAQGPPEAPWLLLETPFEGIGAELHAAADRLLSLGYGILLAHPERARGLLAGMDALGALLDAGVLLQVNVGSLRGEYGRAAHRAAHALVRTGRAHCLASDGHPGTRDGTLGAAPGLLAGAGVTGTRARRLTHDAPHALLRRGIPRLAPLAAQRVCSAERRNPVTRAA